MLVGLAVVPAVLVLVGLLGAVLMVMRVNMAVFMLVVMPYAFVLVLVRMHMAVLVLVVGTHVHPPPSPKEHIAAETNTALHLQTDRPALAGPERSARLR